MPDSAPAGTTMDDLAADLALGAVRHDWEQGIEPKNLLGLAVAGYLVIGGLVWLVGQLAGSASSWIAAAGASCVMIPALGLTLIARARARERELRCRIHEKGLVIRDRGVLVGGRWEQLDLHTTGRRGPLRRWVVTTPRGPFTMDELTWHRINDIVARVRIEQRARDLGAR